ncbi:hypothetical protein PTQ19_14210 [Microbacterium esteraromaticum]|uniref:hypothetical protein n=1 Tax=Microbacterium esteraromaticum TaxID=57043 RepID=UPI0023684876|nr:hypothetical protein [Microbacterium esteraromaticum]WDH78650.1 hypothetical protein PTQ19_14210 [Microbacterium esteraromaticum]
MSSAHPLTDDLRARRRTWLLGGVLFVAYVLVGCSQPAVPGLLTGWVPNVLFGAGAVVFAIGLGRAGSVTGRQPLGTGAIIALAVWQLLAPMWGAMLFGPSPEVDDLLGIMIVDTVVPVVAVMLAAIAVVQIARAGVVPPRWRWAPLWALIAVVVVPLLEAVLNAAQVLTASTGYYVLLAFGGLIHAAAMTFLGVLAIALASQQPVTATEASA